MEVLYILIICLNVTCHESVCNIARRNLARSRFASPQSCSKLYIIINGVATMIGLLRSQEWTSKYAFIITVDLAL